VTSPNAHRVGPDHFDDPPGVGAGAFFVLALHGAAALVVVGLVYWLRIIDDMTAVWLGFYGGLTQLLYVVPLLLARRGPELRRFRIGVLFVASITFIVSAFIVVGLATMKHGSV
jgi:hypothetical protein